MSTNSATTAESILGLEWVVNEVLSQNPALKSARANWEAMKARVPQARAWADLRGGVDVERSGTTRFDTFSDNEWMLAQELPLSGKNRKRAQAATAEAAIAFESLRRRELDLIARARAAYHRYANGHEQLEINRRNRELVRQFVEISRAKYEAGRSSQAEILTAETDLAKLTEARFDIERQISDEQSRLNVLMDRPPREPLGRPAGLAFVPGASSVETLEARALARRPELLTARQKIAAAQARFDLAKRAWIPDPEVRFEARQFNGRGGGFQEYDTGIFFNFPWINRSKYKAEIEEARKNLDSARYDLESERRETSGLIRDQWKKIETLHHHYELFRDRIVPLARQAVRANQAAYETDKASLLDLIVSQRTLQEVESALANHLSDYLVARAELEAIVGTDLDRAAAPAQKRNSLPHEN